MSSSAMDKVVAGISTKSEKIRALGRAGYKRTEIANYIGVRYQFVRNVLVEEARRTGAHAASQPGLAEDGRSFDAAPLVDVHRAVRIEIAKDGAMTLPPAFLAAAGLPEGGVLLARFDDDEIKLVTPEATARKIQAAVRKFVPEGVSLVDELLKERRREAAREQGDA